MRRIAPAGTPIGFADMVRWIEDAVFSREATERLRAAICRDFSVNRCFFVSTGRAALAVILRSLRTLAGSGRDEVIIPSYTCWSVPSSIVKAGLKIRVGDVNPDTLDYDYGELEAQDFSKVLCIVTANLYGIPDNLPRLSEIARERGVYLVDDAAQCMGGSVDGRYSGTFGIAGIYSLDKGKNITSMEGGIIVTDSEELSGLIEEELRGVEDLPASKKAANVVKILAYAAFLHPRLYWIPEMLPFLNLGTTVYTTDYPVAAYSPSLAALAAVLFEKREGIEAARVRNAALLGERIDGLWGVRKVAVGEGAHPVYLRYPVLVEEGDRREIIVRALTAGGLGASKSYPAAIGGIPGIGNHLAGAGAMAGGERVARQIVTLPTHPYVGEDDVAVMAEVFEEALGG